MALGQNDVKQLIEDAVASLSKQIVDLPSKDFIQGLINDVSVSFSKKLDEQEMEINNLKERVEVLESKVAVLDRLESRIDDGEQYSRRNCLRFHGMELPPVGSKENCFQKTKEVIEKLSCGVDGDAIDRAHRIGPVTEDEEGKRFQQIIVRFKSFKDRTTVYKNRKKVGKGARIRLDVTKRRLAILLAVRVARWSGNEQAKPAYKSGQIGQK